jgi:hypothetical protein
MERNDQSPFWNQDAIMSAGLAFAGMAVLQGKLLPAIASARWFAFGRLLDWRMLEWWPVLLIAGGVVLWLRKARQHRSRRLRSAVQSGGGK